MPSTTTTTTPPRAITITYALSPPSGVDTTGLEVNKTFTFPITSTTNSTEGTGEEGSYYAGLRSAIAEAKTVVGEDLTVWRDRVGKAEVMKEPKAKDDDDDEEDEDEGA